MKRIIIVGIIVLLMVGIFPASAQQSYSNASGLEVIIPPGWTPFDVEGGIIIFSPDESAGAWFQIFDAPPGSIGNTCLPIVMETFRQALNIENITLNPESPNIAYIDYDNNNGIGMLVCDEISQNRVIGSALVSAQNTYDNNWPLLAEMYVSLSITTSAPEAVPAQPAQPAQPATTSAGGFTAPNGISINMPNGWEVVDLDDVSVFIMDTNQQSIIYLEFLPRTPDMTLDSCMVNFVDQLQQAGLSDLNVTTADYLDDLTVYAEMTFSAGATVGVAFCTFEGQIAEIRFASAPQALFDSLWPIQLDMLASAQFPGGQAAQAPAQPAQPASPNVVTQQGNINDPFAALGGAVQPQQPAAGNNPFAQSGVVAQSPSNLTFVSFTDPNERAFTVDVPQGWLVDGGMHDVFGTKLIFYSMIAPDESVLIFVGQTEILVSLQPTPQLTQAGYPEGTVIYTDNNFYVHVAPYLTGKEAAQLLAETTIAPFCQQFTFTEERELEEASGFTPDQTAFVSAGEVAYTCMIDGVPAVGYQYATTYATVDPNYGEIWMIQDIYGFVAEASSMNQAITALGRSINSLTYSDQWITQQQQIIQQQQFAQQQQQQMDDATYYALLSQMSAMQHETNMMIINSIGGGSWEWEYTYDYGW